MTFSKASEAALAIEEMNGKSLKDGSRNVKVSLLFLIVDMSLKILVSCLWLF